MRRSLILFSILFLSFFNVYAKPRFTDKLECAVLPPIVQSFLIHHVQFHKLDSELEHRTIEQFITKLDPSKIYFLKSDIKQIKSTLKGIFKKLGENCFPLWQVQELYVKRLEEAASFAKKTLEGDFQFLENTELILDPKLREWPTTSEKAQGIWLKFLEFQISNYLASDMKLPQAKKQLIHRYELNVKRQKELKKDELYAAFLDAYATSLDAHSGYLGKDMLEDFEITMRLSLEGIGAALIWEDGYTTIDTLIPGGAAEKSGELQPKDKIIAVAQGEKGHFEQVVDMSLRDVVRMIRGKKGTTVRLTILRQGPNETIRKIVSLTRDQINLQDEAAYAVYTTKQESNQPPVKIAVVDLPSFYGDLTQNTRSSFQDMKVLMEQVAGKKVDGVVLDLSKNGGGLLSEAVRIAGLFIKRGNVVATQDSKQKLDILSDEDSEMTWKGPLVILTSRLSASASEIVSGALQDYHRAVVVGADHTFGKGTVQAMMNLPANLGAIKVTTGMFFIPGGNSTQQRGVVADIPVPGIFSIKDIGEASLDYSLPPKSVTSFLSDDANDATSDSHWVPVTSKVISKLKHLSTKRVAKNTEFQKIKKDLADAEAKKGVIILSQSLKKQKEENAKEASQKSLRKSRHRHLSDDDYLKQPQVQEAIAVMADLIHLTIPNTQAAK